MNLFVFVGTYLLFMIPTYVVRFAVFGSALEGAETSQIEATANAANITLAICLALLVLIAILRGRRIGKPWLVIFPVIALVFDLLLVFIPFVPTVMHILALVLGSIEDQKGIQKS